MKRFRKNKIIISLFMLMVLFFSNFNSAFAFDIGSQDLISLGECEKYMTYNGVPIRTTYIVYQKDNTYYPAYCLDVTKPGAEEGTYAVIGSSKLENEYVWRAIINGYPYKSVVELGAANEQEAFYATKQAVYSMLYNRDILEYNSIGTEAGDRVYNIYKNIVMTARSSEEKIENNPTVNIECLSEEWTIDSTNKTCISKTYVITSNVSSGNVEIYINGLVPDDTNITDINNNVKNTFSIGESFKILIPIQNLTQSESFTIEANAELETKPVVYGTTTVSGTQDYALTGYIYEEVVNNYVEDYFKNLTKLTVIKKEYATETRLGNVKFNLLNENKEIVQENLITNENGEIVLENMLPGFYYLQEVETLENYNLYTDLIEIGLDLNEEFTVTVNNVPKEVTEVDKNFENVEVIAEYENVQINSNYTNTQITEKYLPVTGY